MKNLERVDWDTVQIVETHDDEGRIALMSESQICELLGLTEEGTTNIPAQDFDCRMDEEGNDNEIGQDTEVLPFLLVTPYQVRWSFHMIRTTHQWR